MPSHWTPEQTKILLDNYLTMRYKELAELIDGKDAEAIKRKLYRMGKSGQKRYVPKPPPEEKVIATRPPAVYGKYGYLAILNRYAPF